MFTHSKPFSFGTSKAGLEIAGLRAQPLTSSGAATGAELAATFAEIGRGMYTFSASVPDDTAFVKGYHADDADALDVVDAAPPAGGGGASDNVIIEDESSVIT